MNVIGHELHELQKMQLTYIQSHYNATHCNLIATISQQFIFNYYATPL
jgi:hypothetical protein